MATPRRLPFTALLLVCACYDYDHFEVVGSTGGAASGGRGGESSTGGSAGAPGGGGADGGGGQQQDGGGGSSAQTGGGGSAETGGGGSTSDGGGGASGTVLLPCGPGVECDPTDNEFCCIVDDGAQVGSCKSNCAGSEATLRCDEPADCPGQRCCLEIGGGTYEQSHCANTCADLTICDPAAPDCNGDPCMQPNDLPDGYFVCDAG